MCWSVSVDVKVRSDMEISDPRLQFVQNYDRVLPETIQRITKQIRGISNNPLHTANSSRCIPLFGTRGDAIAALWLSIG